MRERLWENLTKGRSGVPGSGKPSDWSILQILSTLEHTDADEIYNMTAVRDLSTSNAVFKSVINNKLDDSMAACLALEAIMKDQVEQLNNLSCSNGNAS